MKKLILTFTILYAWLNISHAEQYHLKFKHVGETISTTCEKENPKKALLFWLNNELTGVQDTRVFMFNNKSMPSDNLTDTDKGNIFEYKVENNKVTPLYYKITSSGYVFTSFFIALIFSSLIKNYSKYLRRKRFTPVIE